MDGKRKPGWSCPSRRRAWHVCGQAALLQSFVELILLLVASPAIGPLLSSGPAPAPGLGEAGELPKKSSQFRVLICRGKPVTKVFRIVLARSTLELLINFDHGHLRVSLGGRNYARSAVRKKGQIRGNGNKSVPRKIVGLTSPVDSALPLGAFIIRRTSVDLSVDLDRTRRLRR
ncbi:hypothetical protein B0H15DRAFT_578633 [Mycena belliarum]|uniref:Uncharacterized protein n=1 Tax=Mycena belliarum TaxID=1033014 RepID=A0AAD6XIC6_9AGAR|nr:hypothetical protein B0H15DRAFT_578633 [Mycena belliae]